MEWTALAKDWHWAGFLIGKTSLAVEKAYTNDFTAPKRPLQSLTVRV